MDMGHKLRRLRNSIIRTMEPTRTKEKRQAQEHMEKSSGAGDEGGTSQIKHNGDNSSRPRATKATGW